MPEKQNKITRNKISDLKITQKSWKHRRLMVSHLAHTCFRQNVYFFIHNNLETENANTSMRGNCVKLKQNYPCISFVWVLNRKIIQITILHSTFPSVHLNFFICLPNTSRRNELLFHLATILYFGNVLFLPELPLIFVSVTIIPCTKVLKSRYFTLMNNQKPLKDGFQKFSLAFPCICHKWARAG